MYQQDYWFNDNKNRLYYLVVYTLDEMTARYMREGITRVIEENFNGQDFIEVGRRVLKIKSNTGYNDNIVREYLHKTLLSNFQEAYPNIIGLKLVFQMEVDSWTQSKDGNLTKELKNQTFNSLYFDPEKYIMVMPNMESGEYVYNGEVVAIALPYRFFGDDKYLLLKKGQIIK